MYDWSIEINQIFVAKTHFEENLTCHSSRSFSQPMTELVAFLESSVDGSEKTFALMWLVDSKLF